MRNHPWYFVALLCILYVVSYIDRLILTLLVEPIKAELFLTDVQMGLLIGPAFAILYAVIGLPIGWLVDRRNRKILLITGVVLWSLSTILSGLATSFGVLFALRMGLALGESVLSAVAVSLIGNLFPEGRRATPSALFVASGTAGVMLSYVIGGLIIDLAGSGVLRGIPGVGDLAPWRLALLLVGVPGLALAAVLMMTTREPDRAHRPVVDNGPKPQARQFGIFGSRREMNQHYAAFFIANAFLGMILYGALAWYPTHLIRSRGITASEAGYIFSTALAIGVVLTIFVPILCERIARKGRADLMLLYPLIAVPVGAALFLLALLQSSFVVASVLLATGFSLMASVNGLVAVSIPLTSPAAAGGRLMALLQLCNNIGGLSVGSLSVAWLSQSLFEGPDSIGQALILVASIAAPIAWVLYVVAWLPYRASVRRTVGVAAA